MSANVMQLIFNWQNDAFLLRQRLKLSQDGTRHSSSNLHSEPVALPSPNWVRWLRLVGAAAILVLLFETSFSNGCQIDGSDCYSGISYATQIFGACFGVLSGSIFLGARSPKGIIRFIQNVALLAVYGFALVMIFGRFRFMSDEEWCPWKEYEKVCHEQCYEQNKTVSTGDCKNVNISICG